MDIWRQAAVIARIVAWEDSAQDKKTDHYEEIKALDEPLLKPDFF